MTKKYAAHSEVYRGVKIELTGEQIQDIKAVYGDAHDPVAALREVVDENIKNGDVPGSVSTDTLLG